MTDPQSWEAPLRRSAHLRVCRGGLVLVLAGSWSLCEQPPSSPSSGAMRPCPPPKPSLSHLWGPSALRLGCVDSCYRLSRLQVPEPPRDQPSLLGHQCGPSSLPCVCVCCVCMFRSIYTSVASLVAQLVSNLPAVQEIRIRSLGRKDPLATHSSILAMDREAWRATVHGVAKSRTRLRDLPCVDALSFM